MKIKISLVLVAIFFTASVQAQSDMEFIYRELTQKDIDEVQAIWNSRDLSPKNVEVVMETVQNSYTVKIVKHTLRSKTHYGAIVVPNRSEQTNLPAVVIADGLWQDNPSLNVDLMVRRNNGPASPIADFIQIYPSYRGRILLHLGQTFYSEGDYRDAFDGATDDTIGMLNVAEALVPQGRFDKVAVTGHSRGGTVALLLAARDPRINTVIAIAAPVDFYRQEVAERWRLGNQRYGIQYTWQFFSDKQPAESRQRMLASSPIYFKPLENVENMFLFHGANDTSVPLWNMEAMKTHLKSFDVNVSTQVFEGRDHNNIFEDTGFGEKNRSGFSTFLKKINEQGGK